ncbi:hypothetical protein MSAN_00353100 [Mycena sanguinolenta]|uniref:DUF6534 domain-containing protein n=1 Tax=Mycena sanguinolenta TaxID=230812 RepID=A0A8H7DKK7_9AGAR|nr:hypothetical protein MSAN_00353100 [Mycena sanguinolenta]
MTSLVFSRPSEAQSHILGGWDLAICFTLFLQGLLCSQFAHYMGSNRGDFIRIKLFVAGLALLTTLKTMESLAIMWIQNVILFENVDAASTMWNTDWISKALILEATVAFYVQMFFCYRLWASVFGYITLSAHGSTTAQAISRNVYIVSICITVFFVGIILGVVAIVFIFTVNRVGLTLASHWFAAHLGIVLCGDFMLTGSIVFWLLRHNESVLSRGPTANILSSLVRLTVQSAAPVALCALVNFVVVLLRASRPSSSVLLMIDFITNNTLPQLYAWSAMWTLNSRDEIVAAGNSPHYTVDLGTSSLHMKTGQISHETSTVTHQGDQVIP